MDVRVDLAVALFALVALVLSFLMYWQAVNFYNDAVGVHNLACQVVNFSWTP